MSDSRLLEADKLGLDASRQFPAMQIPVFFPRTQEQ